MGLPAELMRPGKNRRSYRSPIDALRRSEYSMAHPEPAGHEEEEHHGSPWPVIIAVGMGVAYVGIVTASIPMLLAGFAIFAGGAGGWIHQDMQRPSSAFYGLAAAVESKLPRVSARKLGLWLFLATEIMFFSAIIGASWTLRLRTTTLGAAFQGPWAQPGEILNVPLTGLNTFILICSSLTMVEALAAAGPGALDRPEEIPGLRAWRVGLIRPESHRLLG